MSKLSVSMRVPYNKGPLKLEAGEKVADITLAKPEIDVKFLTRAINDQMAEVTIEAAGSNLAEKKTVKKKKKVEED